MTAPRDGHAIAVPVRILIVDHATPAIRAAMRGTLGPITAEPLALGDSLTWRAYVAVAARGRLGAGGLSRRLKITRPRAAALLAELEERGAVFENYRRRVYRPAVAGFPPPVCL